jgi:phosphatidate cytidylyltransferase
MLIRRMITALILIPLTLWVIFKANDFVFRWVALAIIFLAGYEWSNLAKLKWIIDKTGFLLVLFVFIFIAQWIPLNIVLWVGSLFWLLALYFCVTFKGKATGWLPKPWFRALLGWVSLTCAYEAFMGLKALPQGSSWILLLFLLIWASDIFAFFAGRRWGKRPLAKKISPNKTLEGLAGGVLGAMCVALLAYYFAFDSCLWIFVALVTVLLGVLGDLFESLLKRIVNVKDSGGILPGHGGILDRIDSLIAALPFYALSVTYLQGSYL